MKKRVLIKNSNFAHWERGQALITLLFFMIIGLTITSAALVLILVNSLSGTKQQQGEVAYQIAMSGVDEAMIRVLRTPPPAYSSESLTVGTGTATISATGSGTVGSPFIINSTGQTGSFVRKVQVQAVYVNNALSVTSQKELF